MSEGQIFRLIGFIYEQTNSIHARDTILPPSEDFMSDDLEVLKNNKWLTIYEDEEKANGASDLKLNICRAITSSAGCNTSTDDSISSTNSLAKGVGNCSWKNSKKDITSDISGAKILKVICGNCKREKVFYRQPIMEDNDYQNQDGRLFIHNGFDHNYTIGVYRRYITKNISPSRNL